MEKEEPIWSKRLEIREAINSLVIPIPELIKNALWNSLYNEKYEDKE